MTAERLGAELVLSVRAMVTVGRFFLLDEEVALIARPIGAIVFATVIAAC